jgi:phenylacetate-coenzyme A ligase PaaK-like adenylate-forming protein
MLDQALSSVPFYRRWTEKDPGPSSSPEERLAALPVLSKRDLRAHVPQGFMREDRDCREGFRSGSIELVPTSGTGDERLSVVWHQPWWDLSEREAARIHPLLDRIFSGPHREAVLTSPLCAGNLCHVGQSPMEDRILDRLLFLNQALDPTSWEDRDINRMADEMDAFQPELIEADPAYLAILARARLQAGRALHQPECIVITYEFPSRMHLRWINRAFPGVPVVSSYGSTEAGHVFTQCDAGTFHQNTATCHVEIQPLPPPRGDSRVGRILVSTLDNPWFVLLRFDIGDLARLSAGKPCPCGRTDGLRVDAIEGRTRDLTIDTRGRAVTVKGLDDALEAAENLTGYHLEQTGPREYCMSYTVESGSERRTADILPDILHDVYGAEARIELRQVSVLPPEQSGKFSLARKSVFHE